MAGLRVHFVMPADLVERIDAALTDGVSRGEFVRRAVERALYSPEDAASDARRVDRARRVLQAPRAHAPNCKCGVCSPKS